MLNEIFRKVEAQFNVRPSANPRKPASATPRTTAMLAKVYCGSLTAFYSCEPKVDGVRVIVTADLDARKVEFMSRRGNPLRSLDHLAKEVLDLFGSLRGIWRLDCEAVAGKGFFNDVGEIRSEDPALDARLWVFDVPTLCNREHRDRRRILCDLFAAALPKPSSLLLIPSLTGVTPEEAFRDFTAQGFEGVMIKDSAAYYEAGRRSEAWLKLKASDTVDAEIVDVVEGKGKCAGMAGHIVIRLGRRFIRVGTGMSDSVRRDLMAKRAEFIGQTAEVAFHCMTPDASLRHPSLVCIRGDK
jgi:ATP-dependent DNA ligase